LVEQPTPLNELDSSDEEERMVERRRRRQRGSGGSHDQPQESHETPRTTQEDSPRNAESTEETHGAARIQTLSAGGVTVNASVYVRKNPARRARPQEKQEAKEARKSEDNERADIQRDIYAKGRSKRGRAEIHDTTREASDRENGEHI